MHAKTGTAEVYGKQTTSWFATYTKDYTIVMTISQGGTGSGASGPAVRNIYDAMYGLDARTARSTGRRCCPSPQHGAAEDRSRRHGVHVADRPRRPGGARTRRQPQAGDGGSPAEPRRPDRTGSCGTREGRGLTRTASPSRGYAPERGTWAKLTARDSLVRRLDWPLLLAALALSAHRLAAGLLGDPQPHRAQPGRPVLLPVPPRPEHRHRPRPDDRHDLARPPHPARRGAGPLRALRRSSSCGAHPARRDHQRRARLDRDRRRLLPPALRVREDHHHPGHGDAARRPGRRGRPGPPRPPHGRPGARPGRRSRW